MDLTSFLDCFCGIVAPQPQLQPVYRTRLIDEKPPLESAPSTTYHPQTYPANINNDIDNLTAKILTILTQAPIPAPGSDLTEQITTATNLHTADFTSYLAERVLRALEATLKGDHGTWGEALSDAYARAKQLAEEELRELWEYAKEHPVEVAAEVLLTLLALGVLARLVPAFVRVLGFGKLGPVEGSFAAWWQRTYAGYVPKGSVWSFLQRMGMSWE